MTLAEVAMSVLIVGVMLPSVLTAVGASKTAQFSVANHGRARLLAMELMSEILDTEYVEPDDTPAFGTEGSESISGRAAFDDVDDYDVWNASPPQNPDGSAIPGLNGWRRTVNVQWVDPADVTSTSASDAGAKRIVVTVMVNGKRTAQLEAVRTDHPTDD